MTRNPRNYWTKEKCQKEALKFNSREEFRTQSKGYNAAYINNWIDEICSHMNRIRKLAGYWNKEKCQIESLKYNNKSDFQKFSSSAYNSSKKGEWLDEICLHMEKIGHEYKRCIYCFEFDDNCVYIGLTGNLNDRKYRHLNDVDSSVYKHIKISNLKPKIKQLTDYIDKNLASFKEGEFVNEYKNNNWNILNKTKTGNLGGCKTKWTFDKCKDEALKYTTKSHFEIKSSGAFGRAKKEGWLDDICQHMLILRKPNGYWIKEKCQEESLKYNNISQFQKHSSSAYNSSKRNGWLNELNYKNIGLTNS